jgi:hypothetical protein
MGPGHDSGWSDGPIEIAIEPLRWSLLVGKDVAGANRWVLRERIGDDDVTDLHLASVPGAVTTTELAAWMTPLVGRPVAQTLVTEALLRQPRAVVDAGPMH